MKVFVSVPSKGEVSVQFMMSIVHMMLRGGNQLELSIGRGGAELPRSRDQQTEQFLDSTCDKFLTIDDDIIQAPGHIEQISMRDELIVGGFYYLKSKNHRMYGCECINGNNKIEPDERGLLRLRYIGTGFLCVHRVVFEQMKEMYPDEWYYPEGSERKRWNYWPMGLDKKQRRWLGEDWWFCQRAEDMGLTVWGDSKIVLGHAGTIIYPV